MVGHAARLSELELITSIPASKNRFKVQYNECQIQTSAPHPDCSLSYSEGSGSTASNNRKSEGELFLLVFCAHIHNIVPSSYLSDITSAREAPMEISCSWNNLREQRNLGRLAGRVYSCVMQSSDPPCCLMSTIQLNQSRLMWTPAVGSSDSSGNLSEGRLIMTVAAL